MPTHYVRLPEELRARHQGALRAVRREVDETEDRYLALAFAVWGRHGETVAAQVAVDRRPRALRSPAAAPRPGHARNGHRRRLTYEERQWLRAEIDRRTRALLGLDRDRRACQGCGVSFLAGFTAGCVACEGRAQARARRAGWASRQAADRNGQTVQHEAAAG